MNPERVGRDGLLRLTFSRRGKASILLRCRYTLPLQVLSPLALDDGACYLLLLNPTGGVLGGDRLRTEIELEEGSHVCLSTPSATRVYRSYSASAEIDTLVRVGRNATVEYLPDPVIPHAGSSLRQSLRVEMDEGSRGIFFDGFAAGRMALNEQWLFRDIDSRIEIFLHGEPLHFSRMKLRGTFNRDKPSILGSDSFGASLEPRMFDQLAGYFYAGSLLVIGDDCSAWLALLDALRVELDAIPGVFGGASLLSHSGCSVRFLTQSAIALHEASQRLWALARRHLLGLSPLALRKY